MIGVVGCSSRKLPVRCPARWLYSPSAVFSQMFQHSIKNTRRTLIASGRHGIVDPDDVLDPYEFDLGEQSPEYLKGWRETVALQLEGESPLAIYASGTYAQILLTFPEATLAADGSMWDRAKSIGAQGTMKGNIVWPFHWILEAVADGGRTGRWIEKELRARGYKDSTLAAQLYRVAHCPLHENNGGFYRNRFMQ